MRWLSIARHFDLVLCFHRHSRFVPLNPDNSSPAANGSVRNLSVLMRLRGDSMRLARV